MKLDIHINLGCFPGSVRGKPAVSSVEEVATFIERKGITHAVILYPRDEYHLLEELNQRSEATLYGLQTIMGKDQDNPTSINALNLDQDKPLWKGIKLAPFRGWWLRKGEVVSGLNYLEFMSDIKKLLKRLPSNSITAWHTQGDFGRNSAGTGPAAVASYAAKFNNLKFIICHSGDYCGHASLSARPKSLLYPQFKDSSGIMFPSFRYAHSRAQINASVYYAEELPNVWLDSSVLAKHKHDILSKSSRWSLGSDYPFTEKYPDIDVDHEKGIRFLEDVLPEEVNYIEE